MSDQDESTRPGTRRSPAGPRTAAVFLDRDNTLIRNDGDLGDPEGVELIQGAAMAVASLRGLGFKVVGVTNQGGVARGRYDEAAVEAVHARIDALLERGANGAAIAGWYFCPYHPRGTVAEYKREHDDRKPAPGMLLRAAEDLHLDLERSWMVGDAFRDTQAGAAAGCRTVLLHPESGRLSPDRLAELARDQAARSSGGDAEAEAAAAAHRPDFAAASLVEAVRIIASQRHVERAKAPKPAVPKVAAAEPKPAESPPPRAPAKAFRPLTLPPEQEDEPLAEPEIREVIDRARPVVERAIKRARGTHGEDPAAAPAAEPAPAPPAPPAPPVPPAPPAPAKREPADRGPAASERPAVRGASEPTDDAASVKLLQQILHELRSTRGGGGDASAATIVAAVLQAVAAVCLLGALWMAAEDDALFQRWALATLFFQGATLTALLLQRR